MSPETEILPQIFHPVLMKGRITNALPSTLVYVFWNALRPRVGIREVVSAAWQDIISRWIKCLRHHKAPAPHSVILISHEDLNALLKVFTNEKRGGLRVISFNRPPFKLLSRKFSKESVQAPSCERHKTTQRTPVYIICKQLLIPNNAIVSGCDTLFTS